MHTNQQKSKLSSQVLSLPMSVEEEDLLVRWQASCDNLLASVCWSPIEDLSWVWARSSYETETVPSQLFSFLFLLLVPFEVIGMRQRMGNITFLMSSMSLGILARFSSILVSRFSCNRKCLFSLGGLSPLPNVPLYVQDQ